MSFVGSKDLHLDQRESINLKIAKINLSEIQEMFIDTNKDILPDDIHTYFV